MNKAISADGTTIAFDRSGEGPPVIVVGGAFSERTHFAVVQLAEHLAPHFTVYNYDRRGRGDSTDTAPYGVDREVDDLHALIADAGGQAHVYGLSSGAALALLAAARGLPITKLVMHEPPFTVDDSRPPVPEDFAVRLAELVAAGRRGDAVEYFMTNGMGMPNEAIGPMRAAPVWPALEGLAHTLVYDTAIMGNNTLPARQAAAVMAPTLVIAGGESPAWLRNAALALADAVPNAEHRVLEGQDHFAPDQVTIAQVLVEFLRS
jgi:pimeloyl-ACP methyl ester carboxylesterase